MKKQKLTETEKYLLEILWNIGNPVAMPVIMKAQEKDWKPSTVHTLLLRMIEKGYVVKEKTIYKPSFTKEEYRALETEDFMDEIHENSVKNLMVALTGKMKLSSEELDDLQQWLDAQKEESEEKTSAKSPNQRDKT